MLAGTSIVTSRPWAGHALIVAGAAAFAAAGRSSTGEPAEQDAPNGIAISPPMLAALAVFLGAALLAAMNASDGAVLAVWLAALAVGTGAALVAIFARGETTLRRDGVPLAVLVIAVASVNLVRLADFPPTVHADLGEIALGADAMNVARDIFRFTSWWGVPGLHHAIQRAGLFFDDGLVGARLPDAVLGVVAAVGFYLAMREIADRRSALVTALCTVGSSTLINTWRLGLGLGPPIVISVLGFFAFLRAARGGRGATDLYAVAGILAGLSAQVNWSARLLPIVLVAVTGFELALRPRIAFRRVIPGLACTTVYALAVAAPLLVHAWARPDLLVSHSDKTMFSDPGWRHTEQIYRTTSFAKALFIQGWRSAGMFHYYPNGNLAGFYQSDRPFFEPLTAALFLLGVATAATRPSERRLGWTLVGLILCLVLDVVTIDGPSYHRDGPAAAMALLLACAGCRRVLALVENAVGGGRGRGVAGGLATVLGASGFLWGTILYFGVQSRAEWGLSNSTAVARRIVAEPAEASFTYLLTTPAFPYDYGNIRFLARGHRVAALQRGAAPPPLFPGVNLFIATPDHVAELQTLSRSLPSGTWEEHRKAGRPDLVEIVVLRIEVPAASVTAPPS